MATGGFDVVIGNPPYVRQEMIGEFKKYFQRHFEVYQGTADLYAYFIEKGVSLLKSGGLFSYIVANKWMRANYGEPLRRWMKKQGIEEVTDFGDLPVFETATTYPCILRIRRGGPVWPPKSDPGRRKAGQPQGVAPTFYATDVKTLHFDGLQNYVNENRHKVSVSSLSDKGWSLVNEKAQALLDKVISKGISLGEYVQGKIYRGVLTGLNEAFVIDAETRDRLISEDLKSADLIKPFLVGKDIKRYAAPEKGRYLILIPKGWTREQIRHSRLSGIFPTEHRKEIDSGQARMTEPGAWRWFSENYPAIAVHLEPYSDKGKKRYDKGEYWWELRTCDYYEEFERPKIMWPEIAGSARFAYDDSGYYANNKVFIIPEGALYLLGLLNSTLLRFFIHNNCTDLQGASYNFSGVFVSRTPIRLIDFNNPSEKTTHDKLVSLVDSMLELYKKKNVLPPSAEREKIEREIAITDEKIDGIVYGLYGITGEERTIIEGG